MVVIFKSRSSAAPKLGECGPQPPHVVVEVLHGAPKRRGEGVGGPVVPHTFRREGHPRGVGGVARRDGLRKWRGGRRDERRPIRDALTAKELCKVVLVEVEEGVNAAPSEVVDNVLDLIWGGGLK